MVSSMNSPKFGAQSSRERDRHGRAEVCDWRAEDHGREVGGMWEGKVARKGG